MAEAGAIAQPIVEITECATEKTPAAPLPPARVTHPNFEVEEGESGCGTAVKGGVVGAVRGDEDDALDRAVRV